MIVYFGIYCLIMIGVVEFLLKQIKIYHKVPEEINKKYPSFIRSDMYRWDNNRPLLYVTAIFCLIPRFLGFVFEVIMYQIVILVILIGHEKGTPIKGLRCKLLQGWMKLLNRIILLTYGVFKMDIEYPEVDYKPYMGPDWKPSYDRPGTVISNHNYFMDVFAGIVLFAPGFVSKEMVKNIPFIGGACIATECIFIDRAGDKAAKQKVAEEIKTRQKLSEQGDLPPIMIFPEGCTTNGETLINFRRGAFEGMAGVQPVIMKWESLYFKPGIGIIPLAYILAFQCCQPYSTLHAKVLPIFYPNEYFCKTHKEADKPLWVTFMETSRKIMSKYGDIPMSHNTLEDKFEFQQWMKAFKKKGGKGE